MPFPATLEELKAAGYVFDNDSACRGCGGPIQWWKTPKGKFMPMDVDLDGNSKPHWATCPNAKDFRNGHL
jgi:hypothetical protein